MRYRGQVEQLAARLGVDPATIIVLEDGLLPLPLEKGACKVRSPSDSKA
jgi:hypothetical protein